MRKVLLTLFVAIVLFASLCLVTSCSLYPQNEPEAVYYDVTLELNGGTIEGSTVIKYESGVNSILPIPSKSGFEFVGWYYTPDFAGNPVFYINPNEETFLYAKFEKLINITYNTNGGSTDNPVTMSRNESITLTEAQKSGAFFDAWYLDPEFTVRVTQITNPTSDIVLYARYLVSYYVTYNLDGGTNNPSNPTRYTAERGAQLFEPEKIGYTFSGWVDEEGNSVPSIQPGTARNITLTATWQVGTYPIKWNLNGGNTTKKFTEIYVYGVGLSAENFISPTRDGMIFIGWFRNIDGQDIKCDSISSSEHGEIELTARWFDNSLRASNDIWKKDYGNYYVTDKSGNASNVDVAFTITVPEELMHYAKQGKLGVNIQAVFTAKVRTQGNATATAEAYIKVNGIETLVCSKSAKGNGYIFASARWGEWGSATETFQQSMLFNDTNSIFIGYRYYMKSNKENPDVCTDLFYWCDSFSYNFYIVE